MPWIEQEHVSKKKLTVTTERASVLDKVKAETHPTIAAEAGRGAKPLEPIKFQPVRSPGIFEGEFAKRDHDIIFHFWPWGLHQADKEGVPRPAFKKGFKETMKLVLEKHYHRIEIEDDRDMGALFVSAPSAGGQQFWHQLAVRAVTDLHYALGGE